MHQIRKSLNRDDLGGKATECPFEFIALSNNDSRNIKQSCLDEPENHQVEMSSVANIYINKFILCRSSLIIICNRNWFYFSLVCNQ